jgi:SAM-dependent methyltransferase
MEENWPGELNRRSMSERDKAAECESKGHDFYTANSREYHERTSYLDSSSFLEPLTARLSPGSLVMDVGCSSGRDLLWLKNRGFRVMGLERAPGLAQIARESLGCEIFEADFETFHFSALCVDAICLIAALVHVPRECLPGVLGRILRACKPGGLVLITMKEGKGETRDGRGRTFYLWSDDDLRNIFGDLGLSVLHFNRSESLMATGEVWLEYVLG